MLILTRRVGEQIRIQLEEETDEKEPIEPSDEDIDQVKVTILGIRNNQVRMGFDAPRKFKVSREEVYRRMMNEAKAGSSEKPDEVTSDASGNK